MSRFVRNLSVCWRGYCNVIKRSRVSLSPILTIYSTIKGRFSIPIQRKTPDNAKQEKGH